MKRLSWLLSLILAVAASAWADATTPPLLSTDGDEHWYAIKTYEQDSRPGIISAAASNGATIHHRPVNYEETSMKVWKFESYGTSNSISDGVYFVTTDFNGNTYYLKSDFTLTTDKNEVTDAWIITSITGADANLGLRISCQGNGHGDLDAKNTGWGEPQQWDFSYYNGDKGSIYSFIEIASASDAMQLVGKGDYLSYLNTYRQAYTSMWSEEKITQGINDLNAIEPTGTNQNEWILNASSKSNDVRNAYNSFLASAGKFIIGNRLGGTASQYTYACAGDSDTGLMATTTLASNCWLEFKLNEGNLVLATSTTPIKYVGSVNNWSVQFPLSENISDARNFFVYPINDNDLVIKIDGTNYCLNNNRTDIVSWDTSGNNSFWIACAEDELTKTIDILKGELTEMTVSSNPFIQISSESVDNLLNDQTVAGITPSSSTEDLFAAYSTLRNGSTSIGSSSMSAAPVSSFANKYIAIYSDQRSGFAQRYIDMNATGTELVGANEMTATSIWQPIAIEGSSDKFYLYNPATKRYIGNASNYGGVFHFDQILTAEELAAVTDKSCQYSVTLSGDPLQGYVAIGQGGNRSYFHVDAFGNIRGWESTDNCSQFLVAEITEDEYNDLFETYVDNRITEITTKLSNNANIVENVNTTLFPVTTQAKAEYNAVISNISADLLKQNILNGTSNIIDLGQILSTIDDAMENFIAAIASENKSHLKGLPIQLLNKNYANSYMGMNSGNAYGNISSDNISSLWIVDYSPAASSSDAVRATLFNPSIGMYISSVVASANLGFTPNVDEAKKFLIIPLDGGYVMFAGENRANYNSLHQASGANIVGWEAADATSWMVSSPDAATIINMASAAFNGTLDGDKLASFNSLTNSGMWSEDELESFRSSLTSRYNYSGDDAKEAAAAVATVGSNIEEQLASISDKVFGMTNCRVDNLGIPNPTERQYTYSNYIGKEGVYAAPVADAQWRLVYSGNKLYLKNGNQFAKSNGASAQISFVDNTSDASPVTISTKGDNKSLSLNDLTLNIDRSNPQKTTVWYSDDPGEDLKFVEINPELVTDGETYYAIGSYDRSGFLNYIIAESGSRVMNTSFAPFCLWSLKKVGNGVQINSIVDGLYLGIENGAVAVTTEPMVWYITPNGANNGLGVSIRTSQSGNAIDAANGGGYVGTWGPKEEDWKGTTFIFAPVPDAYAQTVAENEKDVMYNRLNELIPLRVEQLRAIPELFPEYNVDYALNQINAIKNDANLSLAEKAKQMDIVGKDLFNLAEGIPFLLINQRRYDRTMNGIGGDGYALYYHYTIDDYGYHQNEKFKTRTYTPNSSFWRLQYAGNMTFYLKVNDEAWISNIGEVGNRIPVQRNEDGTKGHFLFRNNTNKNNTDATTFGIISFDSALYPGTDPNGFNLQEFDSGNEKDIRGLEPYRVSDYGSQWRVQIPATLPQTDYKTGEEDIFVISGLERGGMLGQKLDIQTAPADLAPSNVNYNASTYWEVMSTDNNDPHRYTLRNLVTGLYLSHDRTWTEEPVEWYIRANASIAENWDEQAQGLRISVSPDGVSIDPQNPANGGSLGTWMGATNDWTGTSWIFTRSSRAEANRAAKAYLKEGNERSWFANDLNEVATTLVPGWAVDPIYTASASYAEINRVLDNNGTDCVSLIAERNALWNEMNRAMTDYFAQEGPNHHFQILNVRRIDMGVNDDEHLLAYTDSQAKTVKMSEHGESQASLWQFQPDGAGNLLLANALGGYVGAIGSAYALTSDTNAAGKLDIRITSSPKWIEVLDNNGEPTDKSYYEPHFYLSIGYAGSNRGLNVSSQVPGLTDWAADDDGSFWILKNADAIAAIDDVTVDGSTSLDDCELFTLQGQPIDRRHAAPGIYIARRRDGSAFKAVIR